MSSGRWYPRICVSSYPPVLVSSCFRIYWSSYLFSLLPYCPRTFVSSYVLILLSSYLRMFLSSYLISSYFLILVSSYPHIFESWPDDHSFGYLIRRHFGLPDVGCQILRQRDTNQTQVRKRERMDEH